MATFPDRKPTISSHIKSGETDITVSYSIKPIDPAHQWGAMYGGNGIGGQEFSLFYEATGVSWKRYTPGNKAGKFVGFTHATPRHKSIELCASEGYTSDKGREVSRDVMINIDMQCVPALIAYLKGCLDSHQQHGSAEGDPDGD